jgi:hypothetical protein
MEPGKYLLLRNDQFWETLLTDMIVSGPTPIRPFDTLEDAHHAMSIIQKMGFRVMLVQIVEDTAYVKEG